MLSNGDLVMNAASSDNVGLYECIAVFSTAGYRNVTLARYSVTSSESQSSGMCYVSRIIIILHVPVYAYWIQ